MGVSYSFSLNFSCPSCPHLHKIVYAEKGVQTEEFSDEDTEDQGVQEDAGRQIIDAYLHEQAELDEILHQLEDQRQRDLKSVREEGETEDRRRAHLDLEEHQLLRETRSFIRETASWGGGEYSD